MYKVVIHAPGTVSQLAIEEHPSPVPKPGEIRIAVTSIGVSYADCLVRLGLYAAAKKYVGWPITPGFEFAGLIDAVGDGIDSSRIGESVCGITRFGAYASEICVPAEQVVPIPSGFDLGTAGAFPTNYLTAWYALKVLCYPRPGMTVLIHSAAGGVGSALVQVAKALECRVVAVVGDENKGEAARKSGADAIINKSVDNLWITAKQHAPEGYDAVFDANGFSTVYDSYRALAPEGRLIIYGFRPVPDLRRALRESQGFNPLDMLNRNRGVLGFNLSFLFGEATRLKLAFVELRQMADSGKIQPPPVRSFPLRDVSQAHDAIESGQTIGKLILVP